MFGKTKSKIQHRHREEISVLCVETGLEQGYFSPDLSEKKNPSVKLFGGYVKNYHNGKWTVLI